MGRFFIELKNSNDRAFLLIMGVLIRWFDAQLTLTSTLYKRVVLLNAPTVLIFQWRSFHENFGSREAGGGLQRQGPCQVRWLGRGHCQRQDEHEPV
jgi:hypothetical protein